MNDDNEIAIATEINLPGGKRIWVPPTGRPFWAHTAPRAIELTDDELREHGLERFIAKPPA